MIVLNTNPRITRHETKQAFHSCRHGSLEDFQITMERLFLKYPLMDANTIKERKTTTLLHSAACRGEYLKVNLLLEHGANINANDNGWTPFWDAINEWRPDPLDKPHISWNRVLSTLIERGADVNQLGHSGKTALMDAVILSKHGLARFLLAHGATTNGINLQHTRDDLMRALLAEYHVT